MTAQENRLVIGRRVRYSTVSQVVLHFKLEWANHCIENKLGTVVFGWNKGQRQEINLGSKTNQKFVQIPTARLKDRIAQLCEQYGIQFVETEESYTSKASFLDSDILPTFGAKPEG